MDTARAEQAASPSPPTWAEDGWFDWIRAHARPKPGWVSSTVGLAVFDAVPPRTARPDWVFPELYYGQRLLLCATEESRRWYPSFRLMSTSGRNLGTVPRNPAEMIAFLQAERVRFAVYVLAAHAFLPPGDALQLELDIVSWSAPDEATAAPCLYDDHESAD